MAAGFTGAGAAGAAAVGVVISAWPWAARLWGAAEAVRPGSFASLPQTIRTSLERAQAEARTQLGAEGFAVAMAEGRTMTPEQARSAQGPVVPTGAQVVKQAEAHPTKQSPTYPAGLTTREVEILRLVAQGLTDTQVAEQLVISPRTVNWHLTSIYSKLQVSSRSAATRYAMEHHLV